MKERKTIEVNNKSLMEFFTELFEMDKTRGITFNVKGYSMRPFLEHRRDQVIIEPPRKPKIDDVVVVAMDRDHYIMHRVTRINRNVYVMQGDGNPSGMMERFTEDQIIGVVSAFIRKGKRIEVDSRTWRVYSAVWKFLKPIRRPLLAIYSVTHKFLNRFRD